MLLVLDSVAKDDYAICYEGLNPLLHYVHYTPKSTTGTMNFITCYESTRGFLLLYSQIKNFRTVSYRLNPHPRGDGRVPNEGTFGSDCDFCWSYQQDSLVHV